MSVNNNSGVLGVSSIDIRGMDLETAMMAVQSQRANMLEAQLKDQIDAVNARNEQVSSLNTMLGQLNAASAKFNADATSTTSLKTQHDKSKTPDMRADNTFKDALASAVKGAGFDIMSLMPSGKNENDIFDINLVTKAEIDGAIATIKGHIDSLSNSQQMDMLRLQSLSNKRNEAFDVMTNFIKKMQESRSSIIGNMR